jgi:hypothetical protein
MYHLQKVTAVRHRPESPHDLPVVVEPFEVPELSGGLYYEGDPIPEKMLDPHFWGSEAEAPRIFEKLPIVVTFSFNQWNVRCHSRSRFRHQFMPGILAGQNWRKAGVVHFRRELKTYVTWKLKTTQ